MCHAGGVSGTVLQMCHAGGVSGTVLQMCHAGGVAGSTASSLLNQFLTHSHANKIEYYSYFRNKIAHVAHVITPLRQENGPL
jgi:hypothetical protein